MARNTNQQVAGRGMAHHGDPARYARPVEAPRIDAAALGLGGLTDPALASVSDEELLEAPRWIIALERLSWAVALGSFIGAVVYTLLPALSY